MDAAVSISQPDWETISHEVLCPLCEYNLRGLTQPRCPECGYQFAWSEVVDPRTRVHPYLFEHHPEKFVRSFFRTLWGSLRAVHFWKSLSPAQPSRPRRLVVYWVLSSLAMGVMVVAAWLRAIVENWDWSTGSRVAYSIPGPGGYYYPPAASRTVEFSWSHLWSTARWTWGHDLALNVVVVLSVAWLIWPWLTLFALSIFQISMARANIRTVHVVRCLVYSFDIGAWLALLGTALALLSIWVPNLGALVNEDTPALLLLLFLLLIVLRLWAAYRWYLRFRHPFWTIVLSQIVAVLLAAACAQLVGEILDTLRR